jgi:hypothetical protein
VCEGEVNLDLEITAAPMKVDARREAAVLAELGAELCSK